MARTEIKVPNGIERRLRSVIEDSIDNRQLKVQIGKLAKDRIQLFMRRGRDIETGKPYEQVGKFWANRRFDLSGVNDTSQYFRGRSKGSRKSNLIFSQQLHDSIAFRLGRGGVEIFVRNTARRRYKGKSGKLIGEPGLTNKRLAEKHIRGLDGLAIRNFLGFDDKGIERIKILVLRFLRKRLRRRR